MPPCPTRVVVAIKTRPLLLLLGDAVVDSKHTCVCEIDLASTDCGYSNTWWVSVDTFSIVAGMVVASLRVVAEERMPATTEAGDSGRAGSSSSSSPSCRDGPDNCAANRNPNTDSVVPIPVVIVIVIAPTRGGSSRRYPSTRCTTTSGTRRLSAFWRWTELAAVPLALMVAPTDRAHATRSRRRKRASTHSDSACSICERQAWAARTRRAVVVVGNRSDRCAARPDSWEAS